jgi:hypothetical protein
MKNCGTCQKWAQENWWRKQWGNKNKNKITKSMWGGEQVFSFLLGTIQGKITKKLFPQKNEFYQIPLPLFQRRSPQQMCPFSSHCAYGLSPTLFLMVNAVVEVVVVLLKRLLQWLFLFEGEKRGDAE